MTTWPACWMRIGKLDSWSSVWHFIPSPTKRNEEVAICGEKIRKTGGWVYDNPVGGAWIASHRAKVCIPCMDVIGRK